MPDNAPEDIEGSELSPRDDPYSLPPLRSPQSIDGEPHEALDEALTEFAELLSAVDSYAAKLTALTNSTMLSEAITLPEDMLPPGGAGDYPNITYELAAVIRAHRAIGIALDLTLKAQRELAKPVAQSRRIV